MQLDDGRVIPRHQDDIISRHCALPDDGDDVSNVPFETRQHQYPTVAEPYFPAAEPVAHSTGDTVPDSPVPNSTPAAPPPVRRSTRVFKLHDRPSYS